MNTLKTALIDLDAITATVPNTFDADDLQAMAELIIELNGLTQPITVIETAPDKYELVDGAFQFYAFQLAYQINDKMEMIRGYIVNQKQVNAIAKMNKLVDSQKTDTKLSATATKQTKVPSYYSEAQKRRALATGRYVA